MAMDVKQRASRAQQLMDDEVLGEVVASLREKWTDQFSGRDATDEEVREARHMVWALDELRAGLQSLVDEAKLLDHRNRRG
jgi:hypothetical protein